MSIFRQDFAALIKHRVDVWGAPPHQRVWDADAKEPAL